MITCDAARALGLGDRVGSMEVGKRDDVSTVLINGQVVMRNRQLLTVDEKATMAEMHAMAQRIAEATRDESFSHIGRYTG